MIKLADNIWKFSGNSNVYLLDLPGISKKILIDTGNRDDKEELINALAEIKVKAKDIDAVIMTHLHYDHSGNFNLFKNAVFYAGSREIKAFNEDSYGTVLNKKISDELNNAIREKRIKLKEADELKINELEFINTPGHTKGSICIFFKGENNEKILFSGDTLFKGCHGRTDLPTSIPSEMRKSLNKLMKYDYEMLCPGHDC